ncbi:hypothetical protein DFP73DRAFT_581591 [Morchella snyderi]|nr:hypothetical protein DFP73DRAFT_581591 [Morchella snyderi]
MSSLSTQVLCTEAAEKKNAELEIHVATYKDTVSGLKKRILGAQKFVDGLGNDYNMLNEKKTQLSKSINQLSWDRDELRRDLKEVSDLTEKAGVKMQEWGDSSAVLKGSQKEIRRRLLAAERDRTQSLESQIQEDRERNKVILESIQDVKAEVIEQLAGLKGTLEGKDGSELMERLIRAQTIMEMRIGEDGGATRNLIHSYSRSIEKLGDRDVDATELLLGVEKRVSNASVSMVDLFYETHKMNAEALSYSDGYISHLNSRITNLEAELKEIYEKYEVSLVESAEQRHVTKEYELRLKDSLKKCDDMSAQVQRSNAVEKTLNEIISTLKKNIGILEARTAEDPSMVATINMLKQKNFNLEKEFSITKDTLQDTILASQTKDGEIETLRCGLETLKLRYKEAEKKIEGFVEEKAGFMALAEEQKTKERIEVETNANMFRKRETSRLHNQIKSLEAQKMKLEADNKEFKTMLAGGANVEIELRTEIQELNKQNADIEASHTGLLQEKIRLENAVSHLTQLRETSNTSHRALERIIGITADELSKALEKINILQSDKELATEEITLKELELERAKSDRSEILTTTRDIIALRIIETNLRAALEESEKENQARTKALDKALKELRDSRGKSKSVFSQHEQDNSPNEQTRKLGGYSRGTVNEHTGVFKKASPTTGISLHTPDFNTKRQNPYARVASEIMGSPFANSPSISPLTSPEPIPETQIDHRTWSNSPRAETPKGSEILDIWDSRATNLDLQHRPSNRTDQSNDFIMSEGSPGDRVKIVDTPPLRSTCPEKRTLTPFTPRPQMLDILENEAEKHTPATPNKPKTPLRYRNTRGTTNDTKKHQNRPRKDRRKKTKDDQEWSEDETESSRNSKGKEEPPNTKKNLRSFKDKKKGGKKNL